MRCGILAVGLTAAVLTSLAAPAFSETQIGRPAIQSAGPLAFTPDGVLFVGDPKSATIFAIETDDTSGSANVSYDVVGLNAKVGALLGTTADGILINDIAVNPASGSVYVSVSRGRGPAAAPVIMQVSAAGEIAEVALEKVRYSSVTLPNPADDAIKGEGRRRRNSRLESITDLSYLDGKVFVAGLSNEDFASNLRTIKYPFESADSGTSVEIFHGAHGKYETRSPVRTFAPYEIDGEPHLLAAYTCTPLVKLPVAQLDSGKKLRGITVAELGNRNRPLDMVVYQKDGKDYVLMANSSRGLMKIAVDGVESIEGITEKIRGTAGLPYETIESVQGVVQLDRLNKDTAVVLVQADDGGMNLTTLSLP